MSNRIIKDFKGWSLIHENKGPNPGPNPFPPGTKDWEDWQMNVGGDVEDANRTAAEAEVAKQAAAEAEAAKTAAAKTAAAAGTSGTAGTSAVTKAVTSVPAAPIVPTPDLTKANAAALTRNDWAAIQTKLNAAELALQQTTLVNQSNPANFSFDKKPNLNPLIKESRSMTKLYEEQLVPDGLVGPKTLSAIDTFVSNYNSNPINTTKLPADPLKDKATATTINPLVLAAIIAASTAPTTQPPSGPTGPAAIAGSVFGPSANITEADWEPQMTKDAQGKDQSTYLEPTSLLLQAAKLFISSTYKLLGTNEDNIIKIIEKCGSASDFYKLNALIFQYLTVTAKKAGMDIAYIINDELEGDNNDEIKLIKDALTKLNVQSSYELYAEGTAEEGFKKNSFKITIPSGSDPETVLPTAVYKKLETQYFNRTASTDIFL